MAICVILTLIQVIGWMYISDFELNVITATLLILAVGFSVDYSVHIAHYFMSAQGTFVNVISISSCLSSAKLSIKIILTSKEMIEMNGSFTS